MLIPIYIFALFFVVLAIVSVFRKHRSLYLQGKITRELFTRNFVAAILGILLAMVLAGLAGRYLSQIATLQITNYMTKLIAGILIGILAGVSVGILIRHTWSRLVRDLNQ